MGEMIQQGSSIMGTGEAVERYNRLVAFVGSGVLVEGTDYGVIPGTGKKRKIAGEWVEEGGKKSLLKPGAEKLATFFGLSSTIDEVRAYEDWTGETSGGVPTFAYSYRCALWHGGSKVAECIGSCNSKEKKYRYRYEGYGDNRQQVENLEPFEQINTFMKMAQKRAFVGAVLIAINASAFFTQDMIDEMEAPEAQEPTAVKPRTPIGRVRQIAIEELGYPALEVVDEALRALEYGKGKEAITEANIYVVLGELQAWAKDKQSTVDSTATVAGG